MNTVKMSIFAALAVISSVSALSISFAEAGEPKVACRLNFMQIFKTAAPAEVTLQGPVFLRGACDDKQAGESVVVPYRADFNLPNLNFGGEANLTINCGESGSIERGLTFRFGQGENQYSFSFDRNNLWDTEDMLMVSHLVQTHPTNVVLNDSDACDTKGAGCLLCTLSE